MSPDQPPDRVRADVAELRDDDHRNQRRDAVSDAQHHQERTEQTNVNDRENGAGQVDQVPARKFEAEHFADERDQNARRDRQERMNASEGRRFPLRAVRKRPKRPRRQFAATVELRVSTLDALFGVFVVRVDVFALKRAQRDRRRFESFERAGDFLVFFRVPVGRLFVDESLRRRLGERSFQLDQKRKRVVTRRPRKKNRPENAEINRRATRVNPPGVQ